MYAHRYRGSQSDLDLCFHLLNPSSILLLLDRWGNPNDEEFYHYMKSYSPVDNVVSGARYPHMLVTGGV